MDEDKSTEVIRELLDVEQEPSMFGKGCTYCLGLFLQHTMMHSNMAEVEAKSFGLVWFNGASDHLIDMQIPDNFPEYLQKKIGMFKKTCVDWGHNTYNGVPMPSKENVEWALDEAKSILMDIDRFLLEVNVKEAEVE